DEKIKVAIAGPYQKGGSYTLVDYHMTSGVFQSTPLNAQDDGHLQFSVGGGGHVLGINDGHDKAKLRLIQRNCRDRLYVETGHEAALDFDLINVGAAPAGSVTVRAFSTEPWLTLKEATWSVPQLGPSELIKGQKAFSFRVETAGYTDSGFVGTLTLEMRLNGE